MLSPRKGLNLDPGQLIELLAPVYGLNDAPVRWHRTLKEHLIGLGFRKSLFDPCLWLLTIGGRLMGLAVIEVDDLLMGFHPSQRDRVVNSLQE